MLILKLLKGTLTVIKYIMLKNGKDAAVACGSVDFRFKSNNNFDIRIDASTDDNQVTISIVKI